MFNLKNTINQNKKRKRRKNNFSTFFMEQNNYFRYNKKGD